MAARKFTLRNMLTEDDGKPSFSRICTGFFMLVMLGILVYATVRKGDLPECQGLGVFVPATVTALYGFNKVANAIAGKNANN